MVGHVRMACEHVVGALIRLKVATSRADETFQNAVTTHTTELMYVPFQAVLIGRYYDCSSTGSGILCFNYHKHHLF